MPDSNGRTFSSTICSMDSRWNGAASLTAREPVNHRAEHSDAVGLLSPVDGPVGRRADLFRERETVERSLEKQTFGPGMITSGHVQLGGHEPDVAAMQRTGLFG